ncbi:hypothetical protein DFS34DRAFT_502831 [Phlyctochytrium arcticum]|nr:hypothetical protein DFS34DRAFT_502831 [Phlyctochytrium arcticum]
MPPKKRASTATSTTTTARKRTKTATTTTPTTTAAAKRIRSKATSLEDDMSTSRFSADRCMKWFATYEDPDDPGVIGPDGMVTFCQNIGVDPAAIEILVVAFKLKAQNMGFFQKNEWVEGMTKLGVDSDEKLVKYLDHFRSIRGRSDEFRDLYLFAFVFAKEDDQRSLNVELAKGMWQILLPPDFYPVTKEFVEYLEEETPVKVINKDQWKSFLEFTLTVTNLDKYDEGSAWPVLFDEFVMWRKRRMQQ